MQEIKALTVEVLPYSELVRVGTLLFEEFPSTVVYKSKDGFPIVREWLDCSDDGKTDRYYFFKTNNYLLLNFINGEISHRQLMLNPVDGFGFFVDNGGEEDKVVIANKTEFPDDYLPRYDVYADRENIVDYEKILKEFNREKLSSTNINDYIHKAVSYESNSETFNLHLLAGEGVKYGTIDTDLLGVAITEFDKVYREIAYDTYLGKNRGKISSKTDKHREVIQFAKTEVFHNAAASYSIFLRPKFSQPSFFDKSSTTEAIAEKIFMLFNESISKENNIEVFQILSDYSISSYIDFLDEIIKRDLKLDIGWLKPQTGTHYKSNFSLLRADRAKNKITDLSFTDSDQFDVNGRFTALNCNTGHFNFESTKNELFSGYFDNRIEDSIVRLNFRDLYKIHIERKIEKKPGIRDPKIEDTLMSHFMIEE
ncbi:hypothetical protein [Gracilimonas sp.]|uniref:hypothetical protein n=1 Tax=Gracilimonas sp. TaxID=1974203 RepID=UPI0032EBFB1E